MRRGNKRGRGSMCIASHPETRRHTSSCDTPVRIQLPPRRFLKIVKCSVGVYLRRDSVVSDTSLVRSMPGGGLMECESLLSRLWGYSWEIRCSVRADALLRQAAALLLLCGCNPARRFRFASRDFREDRLRNQSCKWREEESACQPDEGKLGADQTYLQWKSHHRHQ